MPDITINVCHPIIELEFPQSLPGGGISSPEIQAITSGTSVSIPAGKLLIGIAFNSTGTDRTVDIGTTTGGNDIAEQEEIPAGESFFYGVSRYFESAGAVHFTGITASVRIYIL